MRIATLCGMGFGTSMMLKLSIEKILAAEGIRAEVLSWDLSSYKGQDADIVVASADMYRQLEDAEATVALVNNLVDNNEIREKVLTAIDEYRAQG